MCIFVSEYSCERVFILQNGMRKKYPSEEGTGLYVFVADDYMALPDDTEPVSYTHLDVYKRQIYGGLSTG